MAKYVYTQEVEASKIHSIMSDQDDARPLEYRGWVLVLEDGCKIPVSREWQKLNRARLGSWLVRADGLDDMKVVHDTAFEHSYAPKEDVKSSNASRANAVEFIMRAIAEGYTPSQFEPSLVTYPHLVSLLSSSFLQEEYGRVWNWYNLEGKGKVAHASDPFASFEAVTRPVIKWVNDHANPHSHVIITNTGATMAGDLLSFETEDYIKD